MPEFKVRYSYLPDQFSVIDEILDRLRQFVPSGDFTLGQPVEEFEQAFADLIGCKHAFGVGSGTDALKLGLRAAGVSHGDEVITAANTFIATVGAINETGARPVLVDCLDNFCLDVDQIEQRITPKTKAIMPVHLTGDMANMPVIMAMAEHHGLAVIEDACQSILASCRGRNAGTWGSAAGFSLHPLKNLNVWGDGGVVVTNDADIAAKLKLLRNHGLANRDEVEILGYNSRLDSVQAIVGNWLIPSAAEITEGRIRNAAYYDRGFAQQPGITLPSRNPSVRRVYHLYMVFAEDRDALYAHCMERGVEAKIHYPIPLYQQQGLRHLGYKPGDFPVTDRHAHSVISFPADQHLPTSSLDYVLETVRDFYHTA